jgi:hypothetical protein
VALGELAGTATVLGAPSRHVLPVSPDALNTLMPAAAAAWRIESMLWTSASVVWSSQYAQLLLMMVTPSLTIALNSAWKLVLAPVNGAS